MRLLEEIRRAFHMLPEECWTPRGSAQELREERFWRSHLQASERAVDRAVAEWSDSGSWPKLDERTAYFLRVQLEHIDKTLTSDRAPDLPKEYVDSRGDEIAYRKAISRILSGYWTEEEDYLWVREAAKYRSPRRVYLPNRV